jgi:UDP-glucose 4-epimerase
MPVSRYAVSKARTNEFALEMNARTGFPVTVLRVFTAYGYHQPRKMFLSQLLTHALLNQRFKMSDGLQKRDFVYVGDVVDAITAAMTAQRAVGRVINIAGGRGIALKDLATKVWAVCNGDPQLLEIGSREKSSDDAFDTEADISLAAELLAWRPNTSFIGDAGPGHPLYDMIGRMREDLDRDMSVLASSPTAQ